jgi:flagellar biosynthetic protein FliR
VISLGLAGLAGFLMALARVSGWLIVAPLTADQTLSPRARLVAGVGIALALGPLRGKVPIETLPALLPVEFVAGLAVGYVARVLLAGAEAGGQLIGLSMELGFAGNFDPSLREEVLATRRIAYVLAALAYLGLGGLETTVRALAVPVGERFTLQRIVPAIIDASSEVLPLGLRAAAPFLIAGFVANLVVAIASRAAPAINVFSVMLAGLLVVGGAVLLWDASALTAEFQHDARHAIDGALRLSANLR